uniref:protein disulfide-isomerase n=1 Tax=Ailuropoda melanoleuca TaxID=9646 RepID=G1L631_AILME
MRSRAGLEREGAGSRRRRRPTRVLLSCQRGGTGSTESGQPPGGRHERHSEPETTTAHARRGSPHSNHRSRASGLGPAATLPPLGAPAALPRQPGSRPRPPPAPRAPAAVARADLARPRRSPSKKKEYPDLFEWFCVKTLKVCCLPGTYGPDCLACQGGSERPCSGNGHCSGDGSRQGDGSCQCHVGYQGATCTDCADGYFSSRRNETHSICTACDESCKTCTGPTNRDCSQCAVGWRHCCVPDVDECAAETPPCGDQQYCENVNGSFVCEECDSTCVGCTGQGPGRCKECIPGYTKESGQCADIDECAGAEKACTRENENCYNTPGSYVCVCPEGFEDTEDACVRTQTLGKVTEDPTRPPSHEDL